LLIRIRKSLSKNVESTLKTMGKDKKHAPAPAADKKAGKAVPAAADKAATVAPAAKPVEAKAGKKGKK